MNKYMRLITIATILGAVGITYAAWTMKDFPDVFDWEEDDDE
jgi:nitrogen fixation-related uncharacterized protein